MYNMVMKVIYGKTYNFDKIYIVYRSFVAGEESDDKSGCQDEMPIGSSARSQIVITFSAWGKCNNTFRMWNV